MTEIPPHADDQPSDAATDKDPAPDPRLRQGTLADSTAALTKLRFGPGFQKPAYGSFCFSGLPGFLESALLGTTAREHLPFDAATLFGRTFRQVVFVLFDAFGWEAFERFHAGSPFLTAFTEYGHTAKLTSQFPSTTAAHVTTLNAGLPVYRTGVCEWYYYEPRVDAVINPFRLNRQGERTPATLLSAGWQLADVLPQQSFFRDLGTHGVQTFSYGPAGYFPSMYLSNFCDRASIFGYRTVAAGLQQLQTAIETAAGPLWHSFYVDIYDSVGHAHGPHSREADRAVLELLEVFKGLLPITDRSDTLLVITADHGQATVPQETEIILNRVYPQIRELLAHTSDGEVIRFGGGPRDLLLYTKPGAAAQLATGLKPVLAGAAEVFTRDEAADLGILGPLPLSDHFAARIGDVLILPHKGHSVAWHDPPHYSRHFNHGHHGGLTVEEMEIPLLLLAG